MEADSGFEWPIIARCACFFVRVLFRAVIWMNENWIECPASHLHFALFAWCSAPIDRALESCTTHTKVDLSFDSLIFYILLGLRKKYNGVRIWARSVGDWFLIFHTNCEIFGIDAMRMRPQRFRSVYRKAEKRRFGWTFGSRSLLTTLLRIWSRETCKKKLWEF